VHGFAFNSSVLWDPERWGRYPTSEPDKSQVSQPYHITTPFFIAHQLLLYAYRRVAEYVVAHTSVLASSPPLPCIVDYQSTSTRYATVVYFLARRLDRRRHACPEQPAFIRAFRAAQRCRCVVTVRQISAMKAASSSCPVCQCQVAGAISVLVVHVLQVGLLVSWARGPSVAGQILVTRRGSMIAARPPPSFPLGGFLSKPYC
jgi:hypothetical protein